MPDISAAFCLAPALRLVRATYLPHNALSGSQQITGY
jgi:hypothetical protein